MSQPAILALGKPSRFILEVILHIDGLVIGLENYNLIFHIVHTFINRFRKTTLSGQFILFPEICKHVAKKALGPVRLDRIAANLLC